jgi:hypothetical protein
MKAQGNLIHYVYVGLMPEKRDRKRAYLWERIEPDDNDGRHLKVTETYFSAHKGGNNIVNGASVGSIWSFPEGDTPGTIKTGEGNYVGMWKNKDQIRTWQADHRASNDYFAALSKASKEMREDLMLESLEPIRHAYWRSGATRQRLILAWVIQQVTKPTRS